MVKTPFAFAAVLSAAVSLAALAAPAIAQAPATAIPTDEYRLPEFGGWSFNPADVDKTVNTAMISSLT